jgi:hypothetical protein
MSGTSGHISAWEDEIVGNRDARGREKKKPKKKEIKQTSNPARPAQVYKQVTPPQPEQIGEEKS